MDHIYSTPVSHEKLQILFLGQIWQIRHQIAQVENAMVPGFPLPLPNKSTRTVRWCIVLVAMTGYNWASSTVHSRRCVCTHQVAALFCVKWRQDRHLKSMASYQKSDSVNRQSMRSYLKNSPTKFHS